MSIQSVALSMVWQYAVWYQHATPLTQGRFPMMVIHHTRISSQSDSGVIFWSQDGVNVWDQALLASMVVSVLPRAIFYQHV